MRKKREKGSHNLLTYPFLQVLVIGLHEEFGLEFSFSLVVWLLTFVWREASDSKV